MSYSYSQPTDPNLLTMYNDFSNIEKRDYEFVQQTCHLDLNALATMVESTRSDSIEYFQYFYETENTAISKQHNVVTRHGIGKNMERLLYSTGYYVGLKNCFPNSEIKRNLYTMNLLLLDAFGKFATISIITVTGASVYKGMAFLGRKTAIEPTVRVFKKLDASEEFLQKVPKYMGNTGVYAFNAATIGLLSYRVYQIRNQKLITAVVYAEKNPEDIRKNLEENLNLYYQAIALRSEAQTPEEKSKVESLVLSQKETVMYYLEELLAEEAISTEERNDLIALQKHMISET